MIINATINGTDVTIIPVGKSQKVGKVRRAHNLERKDYNACYVGGPNANVANVEDLRYSFPETAEVLEAHGVDLDNLSAWIEVHNN